jgi:multicomponent Na+:H+ antiporter subunit F
MIPGSHVYYVIVVSLTLYVIAMILYSYRALKGPSVSDTVLAIDALTVDLSVIFLIITLYYKCMYLAIAVIPLAAWVFILDIMVAKYLIRRGGGK